MIFCKYHWVRVRGFYVEGRTLENAEMDRGTQPKIYFKGLRTKAFFPISIKYQIKSQNRRATDSELGAAQTVAISHSIFLAASQKFKKKI